MPRKKAPSTPGGTVTQTDNTLPLDPKTCASLSHTLGLSEEQVKSMLSSKGNDGPKRRALGGKQEELEEVKAPMMSGAWADFMDDDCADVDVDLSAKKEEKGKENQASSSSTLSTLSTPSSYPSPCAHTSLSLTSSNPGHLAQTGTLDWDIVGRTRKNMQEVGELDLSQPTLLTPDVFEGKLVAFIACSSTACHSIAVTSDGTPYGWGRNECGQLGSDPSSTPNFVTPIKLKGPWGRKKIVSAAVGKSHTVLISEDGAGYGCGKNSEGQLGINSITEANVTSWKVCKIGGDKEVASTVKLVQVKCGENFTVALDGEGKLYTCGNSEFGTLGNGSTGEHFINSTKIGWAPSKSFLRRDTFVRRELKTSFKDNEEPTVLPDSHSIRISKISCGKFHAVAVEAPREGCTARVFTWGCGNYGSLGHKIQKDEYYPRLVESLSGPMFTSNEPVDACCGSTCCIVKTSQGHGYYWGKHKTGGEAAMVPMILDFLANNKHVIGSFGCGNAHVTLATTEGQTVTYGQGPHGELGFGPDGAKSSAQPKFIDSLDDVDVLQVGCGYGHTAFVVKEGKAQKKLDVFEGDDEEEEEETPSKKQKTTK
mmetsp:Transcript_22279/g.46302  ORF Transcript_22279/g.46302 Transcript_22279/m.46302 type:complete len:595 (+) Transcript_22279:31-1815(+)